MVVDKIDGKEVLSAIVTAEVTLEDSPKIETDWGFENSVSFETVMIPEEYLKTDPMEKQNCEDEKNG